MADDERPEVGSDGSPSLELPSLKSALGLGRKRQSRAKQTAGSEPPVAEAAEAPDEPSTPVVPAEPGPALTPGPIGLPETQPEVDPTAVLPAAMVADDETDGTAPRPRPRRHVNLHLPGPVVALLTGAIVGLVLVGLTSASLNLCSSMRGTSSCGKPGILLLLVITVAVVFLGSLLLRIAGVDAHGSTSFLGVGLLVVVILIALLPVIFHWWMVIVVPVVAMLTYAVSWWLTTTYVEPGERMR
jgi:hypothetical protein